MALNSKHILKKILVCRSQGERDSGRSKNTDRSILKLVTLEEEEDVEGIKQQERGGKLRKTKKQSFELKQTVLNPKLSYREEE